MLLNTLLAFTLINVTTEDHIVESKEAGASQDFFFFFFVGAGDKKYFSKRSRHKFNPRENKQYIKMEGKKPSPQNKTSNVRVKEILDFGRKNRSSWALKYCFPTPWKREAESFSCARHHPQQKKKKTVQVHMPVHTVLSSHMKGGRKENG